MKSVITPHSIEIDLLKFHVRTFILTILDYTKTEQNEGTYTKKKPVDSSAKNKNRLKNFFSLEKVYTE